MFRLFVLFAVTLWTLWWRIEQHRMEEKENDDDVKNNLNNNRAKRKLKEF